jgi:hypothetical protein
MGLRRRHLVHQVGGVYRLVLLLRIQQLGVDGIAEKERVNCLILVHATAREEGLEVGVCAVVACVGREMAALRTEMWAWRLLWYALAMLQEVRVGDGRLVRELLGLGGC